MDYFVLHTRRFLFPVSDHLSSMPTVSNLFHLVLNSAMNSLCRFMKICAFFSGIALSAFLPLLGSPVAILSIDQLAAKSDCVVHGIVIGKSVQKDAEGRIYTQVRLHVQDVWKGKVKANPFAIVHGGGILGSRRDSVSGGVGYKLGEEVVVFLAINSRGEGVTLGMRQGKFRVWREDSTKQRYAQSLYHGGRPAKENAGYRLPARLPLTLETLKRQVSQHKTDPAKPATIPKS